MSAECRLFERALARGEDAVARLSEHAAGCETCRARLALWKAVPESASGIRKSWESPQLPARIAAAIAEEGRRRKQAEAAAAASLPRRKFWFAAAAAAALVVLSMIGLSVFKPGESGREPYSAVSMPRQPLMTEQTLADVEGAETRYRDSIERLSNLARPRLEAPTTALLLSYREKLQMLDSAIAECRGAIDQNRFNTNLRRELLAMYQEKQKTLQQLMKEDRL